MSNPADGVARWTLAGHPASAGQVRALLRESVPEHAALEDIELTVSELVTNAVEHGGGPVEVAVDRTPGLLRITVTSDAGTSQPQVQPPSPESEGGRGLAIVAALADQWGWHRAGDRLSVWAEFQER